MGEDQQRAAERIPLENPIDVMLNDVGGRIIEISLIGCKIEHPGRVNMGSTVNMDFLWKGRKIRLKAKVTRTEMRPISGKPGYLSALQLASSLEESPVSLRWVIAGLLGQPFDEPLEPEPEPVKERVPDPAVLRPPARPTRQPIVNRAQAAAPIKPKTSVPLANPSARPFAKQPPGPPQMKPQPPIPLASPARQPVSKQEPALPPARSNPPLPLAVPVPPRSAPVVVEDDQIEEIAESAEILYEGETEEIDELGVAEEIDETPPDFIECILAGGKWTKRHVRDPRQPREGFTMLTPEDERDIDQYCRSYEVADPETRRMIRISFELTIARRNQ